MFLFKKIVRPERQTTHSSSFFELGQTYVLQDCLRWSPYETAPSFKEINADVRGRTNVEQRFIRRVTTRTKAEVKNKEVDHEPLKTKDEAEVRAVVQWIMSR